MATPSYVLLEKITVGAAGASSITFSGIPQTGYTDLVIKASTRDSSSAVFDDMVVSFNGSTASMTRRFLESTNGTSAGSGAQSNSNFIYGNAATATASTFGNSEMYIPNYTSSNYKSISVDNTAENNATAGFLSLLAGLWSNTAAITSITLTALSGSFVQYSTFYLYGVAKLGTTPAIVPYATGGDTIMTDGTYWYHAFKASGTFTPQKGLSADVLVVAGGGGGGGPNIGGGGGAGGIIYFTNQSLSTTGYTCTVGAGGAVYASGNNSQFESLTVGVGGGRGGGSAFAAGYGPYPGGSGGGTGNDGLTGGASTQTGTGATAYYGNAGGGVATNGDFASGGGAGAAGTAGGNSANAAAGGVGISTYSSWGSVTSTGHNVSGTYWFGGGGASGANDSAGGTLVTTRSNGGGGTSGGGGAVAGLANTGGGGGGWSYDGGGISKPYGAGGSGVVIIRYAV